MSETAVLDSPTTEAAPEPVATPEPAPAQAPQQPMSPKREAFLAMKEAQKAAREQANAEQPTEDKSSVVDLHGRKHAEDGKYLPKEAAEPGGAGSEAPPAEMRTADEPAEAPAAERPTMVRIPIPADHPLRAQGAEYFDVLPDQEQVGRAAINAYARRKDLDAAAQREADLKKERDELRERLLRIESGQAATAKWQQTPEYQAAEAKYHEIVDTFGQEAASAYWRGIQGDLTKLQEAEYGQRMSAIEAKEAAEAGERWVSDAWERASAIPADIRNLPTFSAMFDEEIQTFDAKLERGFYPHIKDPEAAHKEFMQLFGARLLREPAVREIYQRERAAKAQQEQTQQSEAARVARERAEAGRAAVEQFKKEAADKRRTNPPNPLAAVAGAARGGVSAPAGAGEIDTSKMTAEQLKRHLRAGAREHARTYFGR